MAFLKKAFAGVVHPNWGTQNWQRFREEHRSEIVGSPYRTASAAPNLVAQASEILKSQFTPERYLLTHATIVASVDTNEVPNVKLGAVSELGRQINRRWANYRVKPACDIYINNNNDCWDRPVLLKSYRTFVGAHNFVEHVQIEEQSKGRIIDAAAREIPGGDSIYVDILIATDRQHEALIRQIQAGQMSTMSMGCSVTETICTKCGNVAADETEMCEHVKYAKGNYEFDNQGSKYRVAELCGHDSLDPTGGVTFIEASWVAVPAFPGAVMRNMLTPEQVNMNTHSQMQQVLASPPPQWTDQDGMPKAARVGSPVEREAEMRRQQRIAQMDDPGAPPPGGDMGAPPPAPGGMPGMPGAPGAEEKDPLEDLEGELEKWLLDKVKKKIQDKMKDEVAEDAASEPELATSTNENINHQASEIVSGAKALLRIARSDAELIDGLARLNQSHGVKISRDIYRTALRVGSTDGQPSLEEFLRRCAGTLGRKPTLGEAKTLVRLGRILSIRKQTRF
jgi:hypothetical protein